MHKINYQKTMSKITVYLNTNIYRSENRNKFDKSHK